MKNLKSYLVESAEYLNYPSTGDSIGIEFEDGSLAETYVIESTNDSVVIAADEKLINIIKEWASIDEDLEGDSNVVLETMGYGSLVGEDQCNECGYTMESCECHEEACNECGYPMESCGCAHEVDESRMADKDLEYQDYKNMNPQQFYAAYKMTKQDWYNNNKSLLPQQKTNEDFDRILQLSGIKKEVLSENRVDPILIKALNRMPDGLATHREVLDAAYDAYAMELGRMEMKSQYGTTNAYIPQLMSLYKDKHGLDIKETQSDTTDEMDEAEYHGKHVSLNKPTRGDVKKFKVYVKDPSTGNVKKVNFGHGGTTAKRLGQKTMRIKKSNPARRKSFRARHHCENPGPKTKARYWSCRAW
jgi:hypothetical protein